MTNKLYKNMYPKKLRIINKNLNDGIDYELSTINNVYYKKFNAKNTVVIDFNQFHKDVVEYKKSGFTILILEL